MFIWSLFFVFPVLFAGTSKDNILLENTGAVQKHFIQSTISGILMDQPVLDENDFNIDNSAVEHHSFIQQHYQQNYGRLFRPGYSIIVITRLLLVCIDLPPPAFL